MLVVGQTATISFGGTSVAQVIKMMELQNDGRVETIIRMIAMVTRNPVSLEAKWEPLLVCLLIKLKEKYRPRFVVLCIIPLSPDAGTPIADIRNGNVTRGNTRARNLSAENSNYLRLMDIENALRVVGHSALTKDRIHFNTQQARQ